MRGWKTFTRSQAGMSLVEATIILMVLSILTSVLAPSMQDFLDDARQTKAKEDCEAIGFSIQRLLNDTGSPFLLRDGDANIANRFIKGNRVDLLVSTGDIPGAHPGGSDYNAAQTNVQNISGDVSWTDNLGSRVHSMYDHLVSNEVAYIQPIVPFDTNDPNPPTGRGLFGFGWRGAYLSPVIGPDPWGRRYAVNSVYLGTGTDADHDSYEGVGMHGVGWPFDTVCVSAGRNGLVETAFEDTLGEGGGIENQNGGTSFDGPVLAADDIVYTISGYGK